MRTVRRFLTALILLSPAAVSAQPPGPPPPPPLLPPAHLMLHQKSVQDELRLTQQQAVQIHQVMLQEMQRMKQLMAGKRPGEGPPPMMHEHFKEIDKKILAVLSKAQQKRLREVTLQVVTPRVFTDADVAAELKLDEEQQQQMRALLDQATQDQRKLMQGNLQPAVHQQKLAALKKSVTAKTLNVLTSEQRSQWSAMTGKAFKGQVHLPPPPPMGFGPPPKGPMPQQLQAP